MHRVKDMELVQVKCDECGTLFDIKYGTYRKTKTKPHYCRACRGKRESNRIKSLSAEEKKAYLDKKNKAISAGWAKQSKEKKQQISQNRISKWDEIHDRKKLSNELTMKWENMTEEEKKIHFDRLSKGRGEYWKDESTRAYHSERARDKWYKQTEEEKERILKAAMDGLRNWYDSLSDEEKNLQRSHMSDTLRIRWDNMSKEGFEKFAYNQAMGIMATILPNDTENDFMDILKLNRIDHKFQYVNKIKHDDFDKLFPYNPIMKTDRVSPYHRWDFIIHTKEKDILVDIDGSIHDCSFNVKDHKGRYFKLKDAMKFNDSQRPYQTDGLDAYVIKCYDDKLTYNTIVESIDGKETYTLFQFITILKMYNGYKVIQ